MIQDKDKFFKLGKVCNSTFGTSGPGESSSKIVTEKTSFKAVDEKTLEVSYSTLVLFPNHPSKGVATYHMIQRIKDQYGKEAMTKVEAAMKEFVSEYQEQFGEKVGLSVDNKTVSDDVEFVSYHISVSVNRAFYRFRCIVEVK